MKKNKKWLFLLLLAFCVSFAVYIKVNDNPKENDHPKQDEKTIALTSSEYVSFNDAVLKSDLIVEVEINGLSEELDAAETNGLPKSIHDATVTKVFSGEVNVNDSIKIMQDDTANTSINGKRPILEGDSLIFMLRQAQPEEKFPNTFSIYKEYLLSDSKAQAIDLNLGDSTFTNLGTSEDPKLNETVNQIVQDGSVDTDALSIIRTEELEDSIEEILQSGH